jgi:hypothetical protein
MRRFKSLLAVLALLAGSPAHAAKPADAALERVGGQLTMDVKPGFIETELVPAHAAQTFGGRIVRLGAHEKWSAMLAVCATQGKTFPRACATMYRADKGGDRLLLRIGLRNTDDQAEESDQTWVSGNYFLGKEVRVKAIVGPKGVTFKVNGMAVMAAPIRFNATTIELACSTAACAFTRLH